MFEAPAGHLRIHLKHLKYLETKIRHLQQAAHPIHFNCLWFKRRQWSEWPQWPSWHQSFRRTALPFPGRLTPCPFHHLLNLGFVHAPISLEIDYSSLVSSDFLTVVFVLAFFHVVLLNLGIAERLADRSHSLMNSSSEVPSGGWMMLLLT